MPRGAPLAGLPPGSRFELVIQGKKYVSGKPIRPHTDGWRTRVDEKRGTVEFRGPKQAHPEKSFGVASQDEQGNAIFVPGFGLAYTEDLKDIVDRVREKNKRLGPEKAAQARERKQAFRTALLEASERRIKHHKAHPVTDPGYKHEKRLY